MFVCLFCFVFVCAFSFLVEGIILIIYTVEVLSDIYEYLPEKMVTPCNAFVLYITENTLIAIQYKQGIEANLHWPIDEIRVIQFKA